MQNKSQTKDPVGLQTLEAVSNADQFNKWMYDQFRGYLKGEVLEIGSGIGNISTFVISDKFSVTLSDYNEDYCTILRNKFVANPLVKDVLNIDLLADDFEIRYTAYKECFDSIFLLNVIEHINQDKKAVNNCRFLLKQNGHLILLAPAGPWLYTSFDKELGHHRRYTLRSLKALLNNNNFRIISGNHFNAIGIFGWLIYGKILKRKMLDKASMSAFDKIVPFAKFIDKLTLKKIGLSIIVTGVKK